MRNKMTLVILLVAVLFVVGVTGCGGGGGGGGGGDDGSGGSGGGDTTSPQVSATTPVNGGVDVATNSAIAVTFNEKMDSETIISSTFFLKVSSSTTNVTAMITNSDDDRTAVLRPATALAPNTSYTATVLSAVTDVAGNNLQGNYTWTFTTGATVDTTPPVVVQPSPGVFQTFPAHNETDVSRNISLVATMSKAIDPDTINNQNFTLRKTSDNSPVTGSVTNVGTNLIFKPTTALAESSNYTATLATGIKDLAGNSLATEYSWSFTTGINFDTQAPQILSVSPSEGEPEVLLDAVFIVTFNEAIMPFEYGLLDGRPVSVSSNQDYTVITMTPDALLPGPGRTYTASVRVSDMASNRMSSAYIWEFSTVIP